jgi:hypothetical protein
LRKRRSAAVFAGVLLAHIGVAVAWLATHPPPRFLEPVTLQIELIRPPERERPPRDRTKPTPPTRPIAQALVAPQSAPASTTPLPPSPLAPTEPRVLDVPRMTDQELLRRAGPRPDMAKVFEEQARQPVFSRALGRNPEDLQFTDCKPFTEHSRRIAPPCPVRKTPGPGLPPAGQPPPTLAAKELPFAAEGRRQDAVRTYKGNYGSSGTASVNDYPGLGCTFAHVNCTPADPTMDPLHPPSREH